MPKPQKTTKGESVVQPTVRFEGEKHILESIFEGDPEQLPFVTSVGYMKVKGAGSNGWVSYVITTKGKEVVKIEVDEPNMRQIAEESAKIAFTTNFIDQEVF